MSETSNRPISLRFCPYCAHGYEWQESDPPEGACAGCRRAYGYLELMRRWYRIDGSAPQFVVDLLNAHDEVPQP